MFSERTRWDLTRNRLSRLLEAKRNAGVALLDLTESNPTRVGLEYPRDLLAALGGPDGLRYEPDPRGSRAARQAVADDHARRGIAIGPERVLLTASTSEAYAFLFKLLCDPGDTVLVPHPGYPLFEFLAGLESVRLGSYPLGYDGVWHIDAAALEERLTDRTRAVVVVNPHNPTGSFVKADEREALETICAARGIAVISDEVFADYPLREVQSRARSFAVDGPALAFALGGLSKSCGLPQVKLGWITVSGPRERRDEAMRRLEVVADTFLSVSTPVQIAGSVLLARGEGVRAAIQERVLANRKSLVVRVGAGSPATLLDAEGGWYSVLRVPATLGEEERVTQLLEEHDVLVHPGYFFDLASEGYLVLSLLPEPRIFENAVDRILASLVL